MFIYLCLYLVISNNSYVEHNGMLGSWWPESPNGHILSPSLVHCVVICSLPLPPHSWDLELRFLEGFFRKWSMNLQQVLLRRQTQRTIETELFSPGLSFNKRNCPDIILNSTFGHNHSHGQGGANIELPRQLKDKEWKPILFSLSRQKWVAVHSIEVTPVCWTKMFDLTITVKICNQL